MPEKQYGQMEVTINKEFVSILLSFGSDLVLLAPLLLKQMLEYKEKQAFFANAAA